jgi:hypothetical protein
MGEERPLHGILLFSLVGIVVLAIGFITIGQPQLSVGLPLHSDSYDNIAIAQRTISSGNLFTGNPYVTSPENEATPIFDAEAGYTSMLSGISLFSGIDIIDMNMFLPWILASIAALTSFVFLRKILRDDFVSLTGAMFVFLLPSTQQMLGPAFLVASNMGIVLTPLVLCLGIDAATMRKNIVAFALMAVASFVLYPPSLIIELGALLCFIVATPELLKKNLRAIYFSAAAFVAFIAAALFVMISLAGLDPLSLFGQYGFEFVFAATDFAFDQLFFRQNTLQHTPFLAEYLGIGLLIFSATGILYFATQEIFRKGNNMLRAIYVPALVISAVALVSINLGRGILVPSERLVFFSAYFVLLCGGVFFGLIVSGTWKKLLEKKLLQENASKYFFACAIVLLSALIISSQPLKTETLQLNITNQEMDGISWINENTPKSSLVLAPPYISKPIYVLTGRQVFCTTSTRFGCTNELNLLASSFFFADCEGKSRILNEYFNAGYIFTPKSLAVSGRTVEFPEQDCDFLEKSFEGANVNIYKSKIRYIAN